MCTRPWEQPQCRHLLRVVALNREAERPQQRGTGSNSAHLPSLLLRALAPLPVVSIVLLLATVCCRHCCQPDLSAAVVTAVHPCFTLAQVELARRCAAAALNTSLAEGAVASTLKQGLGCAPDLVRALLQARQMLVGTGRLLCCTRDELLVQVDVGGGG